MSDRKDYVPAYVQRKLFLREKLGEQGSQVVGASVSLQGCYAGGVEVSRTGGT